MNYNSSPSMNKLLNYEIIQSITNGLWITKPGNPTKILRGGAFDTRQLGDAQIFFAWKGENSDGHLYLNQLETSGIELILVEQEVDKVGDIPILKVVDSLSALQQLAKTLVAGFEGKVVNITGSSGKTTTKEWLKHIINGHRQLLTNVGSFNNHIGCPITILNMEREHELLALEMGTSGSGELLTLTSIAPADIAVLLNVGHAHLGMFGSLEKTYQAKMEIFSNMKQQSVMLIPYGDERLVQLLENRQVEFFGQGSPEFSWECLSIDPFQRTQTIQFITPFGSKTVVVNRLGEYVGNLISCILAICYHLGLSWAEIEPGLSSLPTEKGRSVFHRSKDGTLILDDTYNANPESVIQMLKTICLLPAERYVGVVGNLAELDEGMKESAGYILNHLPEKLTDLILSGETGKILFHLVKEHHPHLNIRYFDSIAEMADYLISIMEEKVVIGVKGSRSAHLERIVYVLKGETVSCPLERCSKLCACSQCKEL
ncbi:UDP-N-acetylmuramoyl-tripeptide--D-alanyl-D-alanine ligase [bacterium]|nr:UDP-N-acetylmuramoyl-tripeptide--D-alanyl-D-alanine ligase [bacterium]